MSRKRICVIGAGASGLGAIKSCKEDDFDVTCFEKDDDIGGLWRYRDTDNEGQPSVMTTTVINTSKENSAFSDFPPPEHFPNYMHHSLLFEYLNMYAKHFELRQHIMFKHEVTKLEKDHDYNNTGRWTVTIRDLVHEGSVRIEVFDGIMVCSGHHIYPNIPIFKGLEDFQGKIMHTHSLKSSSGFESMRVLVIGIGNSGVDAAVELSRVAKQVYLSTRRGSWIIPRVSVRGYPVDLIANTRIFQLAVRWNFFRLLDKVVEFYLNFLFNHETYKLKPKHRIFSAHPTTNDAISNAIINGRVMIKQDIDKFQKAGVVFENENTVTEIDAIILATGYKIKYPFLDDEILQVKENKVELFKLVYPPNLSHVSLAFIGLFQPLGCIFPISEAQSRWFCFMMKNNLKLPSKEQMEKEINSRLSEIKNLYVDSPRHTIQVNYVPYMDEICSEFGAKPNLVRLALTDPKLFWACWFRSCVPYQYRIHGPHSWDGARDAILTIDQRVQAPFNTRQKTETSKN